MEPELEIIDAFVDGERVDAAALKRALASDAGRDYLVDAWLLREGVQEDMAREHAAPVASVRARNARKLLFAAAVLLCLGGGYAVGYRAAGGWTARTSQSAVTTKVAPPPPATVSPSKSFPVPAATRVIQVDFAVSSSGSGGD